MSSADTVIIRRRWNGPDTTDTQTKQFADAINAAEAKLSASMHVW